MNQSDGRERIKGRVSKGRTDQIWTDAVGLTSCFLSSACSNQRFKRAMFVHSFIPLFFCPAVTSVMKIIASFLSILKTRGHNFYLISKVCTYFFLNLYGWNFFVFFVLFFFASNKSYFSPSLISLIWQCRLLNPDRYEVGLSSNFVFLQVLKFRNDLSLLTESQVPKFYY